MSDGLITTCSECDKKDYEGMGCETCNFGQVTVQSWQIISLYFTCQARGIPPRLGGVLDQDPRLMLMFSLIDGELQRFKTMKENRAMRKLKRGGKRG